MPRVILYYKRGTLSNESLYTIGNHIRPIVAAALNFKGGTELASANVEWFPIELHQSAVAPPFSIDLETIGFANRKILLAKEYVLAKLRADILAIPGFPKVSPDAPLIWIKYVDPDGAHF